MLGIFGLDFCMLCGKYDTIQTYVPVKRTKKHRVYIHICEDCSHKYSREEIAKKYNKGTG